MPSGPDIMMIKLMWLRWVELVLCVKKNRFPYRVLVGILKTRICLEDLNTDRSIILKHLEETGW
jgi:hypothetical protein